MNRGDPGALRSNERHHPEARLLPCPEDVELFFDDCEILVAGGEGGFEMGGQGGGEAVDVGEIDPAGTEKKTGGLRRPPLQMKVKRVQPGMAGPQRLKRGRSIPTRSGQVLRPYKAKTEVGFKAKRAPRV